MSLSPKDFQSELATKGFYKGTVDGIEGPQTRASVSAFLRSRQSEVSAAILKTTSYAHHRTAAVQLILKDLKFYNGAIDGRGGPEFYYAVEQWQNRTRQLHIPGRTAPVNNNWPNRSQLQSFYGAPGTGHTSLNIPFPMRIAWDTKQTVNRVTVHSKCADSLDRILKEILQVYGYEEIKKLGIDLFGGIYNNRPIRGGTVPSVHAYAAAIDLDPEKNQLRWGSDKASFAKPVYSKMIDAFEREGWVSLGKERNFDWMHFQASVI
jgi:hypothetical protein